MTTLLSILDDSDGKLAKDTRIQLHYLQSLYDDIIVIVTDSTLQDTIDALGQFAKVYPKNGLGNARRLTVKLGLQSQSNSFHYCDFDRIIYWSKFYPAELSYMVGLIPKYDFLIFGRTQAAFNTHPELQRITEYECNLLFGCDIDILSGSRGFNRQLAQVINNNSIAKGAGTDAEWPILAKQFHYIECNGLEYESTYFGIEKSDKEELEARIINLNNIRQVVIENNWHRYIYGRQQDNTIGQPSFAIQPVELWSIFQKV